MHTLVMLVTAGLITLSAQHDRVVMGTGEGMTKSAAIEAAYKDAVQHCGDGEAAGAFTVISTDGDNDGGWGANVSLHCTAER